MIPSIIRGLRQTLVYQKSEDLSQWINKELLPFLQQVRTYANYVARVEAEWTTEGTAAFETMWSSEDIAVGSAVRFDVSVIANAGNDRSIFTITGLFRNTGAAAQEGATVAGATINAAGGAVQFLVVANHVELQVQDWGGVTVDWLAIVDATVIP